MNAPSGSLIAYSTAPGKTALDGRGKNSPYTAALLQHINTPNITVLQMFQKVRSTVRGISDDKQVPWESTSLSGDFYFSTKGTVNRFSQEQARLERERREFEQAKAEFEQQRKESTREKVEVASVPQKTSYSRPSSTSDVSQRDGIYVAYANGIVKDTKTGLEWKVGPDENTNWNEAKAWVESLNLDGGGWRMPTLDELEGLYKNGTGDRNMTPLLKTTGWNVWSGETKGSSPARIFGFYYGRSYSGDHRSFSSYDRAFAVRSRKESQSQKIEVASIPQKSSSTQPSSTSNVIERDGIYVAYANGIVKDSKTGLEWKAGPDRDTTWDEARSWVQSLNLDGGGWRIPAMDELGALYSKGKGDRNMTPLLKTSGWGVWSGETKPTSNQIDWNKFDFSEKGIRAFESMLSPDARIFGFGSGSRHWNSGSDSYGTRGFAVRSRSDG